MLPIDTQLSVEYMYSKKNIRKKMTDAIMGSNEIMEKVDQGITLLQEYANTTYSYDSKNGRMERVRMMDLETVILDILIVVLPIDRPMLFTSVVGQLAGSLSFDDKRDGAATIAEMLAVLCQTDLFDILKENDQASLEIVSNYDLPPELAGFIQQTKYLPPMVCPPRIVRSNYDSGYLSFKDSLILKDNFHEGDICLDSINKFNQIPLSLDVDMLSTYSEPPRDFDDPEKKAAWQEKNPGMSWETELTDRKRQWENMVRDSIKVFADIVKQGNCCYLTHKVDKRGRTYAQGYHVSSQGNSFRKAILNLAEKEVIGGI